MHASRITLRTLAYSALLAVALTIAAAPAGAAPGRRAAPAGSITLAKYVGCAAGLAFAKTPALASAALTACLKMIAEEWKSAWS